MKNIYDYILQHFVSNDRLRPDMQHPHEQDSYVFASDISSLIRIPAALVKGNYVYPKKKPDFTAFFSKYLFKTRMEMNISDLEPIIAKLKVRLSKTKTECKSCNGSGTTECEHCGNLGDCEKCKGSGGTEITDGMIVRDIAYEDDMGVERHRVKIHDYHISAYCADLLYNVMLFLRADKANIYFEDDALLFEFDKVIVLIMTLKIGND
jgi:hypothetical protein